MWLIHFRGRHSLDPDTHALAFREGDEVIIELTGAFTEPPVRFELPWVGEELRVVVRKGLATRNNCLCKPAG